MRCFLLGTCGVALLFAANARSVRADGDQPSDVAAILKAKDFWDTTGKAGGRKWTEGEKKQLEILKSMSKDSLVRLRANKMLVDLGNKGRIVGGPEAEIALIGGFRYLETILPSIPVHCLCVQHGFTHYVSNKNGVFLLEHVEARGFNGGLNLKWDFAKKAVVEIKSWGDVPAN